MLDELIISRYGPIRITDNVREQGKWLLKERRMGNVGKNVKMDFGFNDHDGKGLK